MHTELSERVLLYTADPSPCHAMVANVVNVSCQYTSVAYPRPSEPTGGDYRRLTNGQMDSYQWCTDVTGCV